MTSSTAFSENHPASTDVEEIKVFEEEEENYDLPETMRAWRCSALGNPLECISMVNDVPIPTLTKNSHILVHVHYASINPIDYKSVVGFFGPLSPELPYTMGHDFSGKVVQIGSEVTKFKIAQSVYGQTQLFGGGSWADFCVAPENCCEIIPENLSFAEAAAIPLVTLTSYQSIISVAKCNATSKLLVLGGSTSCGLMAMQIASAVGCKQITCTSSSVELCESFGAERVINYKESEWELELKNENFDIIYDCIGGEKAWDDAGNNRVIASDGIFVTIVGDDPKIKISAGKVLSVAASVIGRKIRSIFGNESYAMAFQNSAQNLDDVSKLIVEGKLHAVLDPSSPYDFEDALEMVEKCMSLRSKGKLILKVFDDKVQNETA